MTRQNIIDEIKRLALIRGGRISIRSFCKESGIPTHQILGLHWTKWNDALVEAGVNTGQFFQPKTEDTTVFEAYAQLVNKLKRWPTQHDLQMERRHNKSLPSIHVIRRVKTTTPFSSKLLSYCADRPDLTDVAKIAAVVVEKESKEEPNQNIIPIAGYVYMMRSGRRYKIGYTSSPARRHREVRLDLPDPTTVVHAIATDDPAGIDAYWKTRLKSKRVRDTEFFTLDTNDVAAFKRWKRIA